MAAYKNMIMRARENGVANEKAMFAGIDRVDSLLSAMEKDHPAEYWQFLRKTHEDLYGCHYDEEFAKWDVAQLHSTDRDGRECRGEHWSVSELSSATSSRSFPAGVTKYDIYVGYNAIWHDMQKLFDDSQILDIAYLFFFADEDAPAGKVWKYVNCLRHG